VRDEPFRKQRLPFRLITDGADQPASEMENFLVERVKRQRRHHFPPFRHVADFGVAAVEIRRFFLMSGLLPR